MTRASRSDVAVCRRLLREGSRSFHAASRLLPGRVRRDASAVYAWCRLGDHAVDRGARPAAALEEVRDGLGRIYGGSPQGPVERAFADTAARNGIPREIPEAMLEGFAWDVEGRPYETLEDLVDYCVRVGSTVGVMMCLLMDRRDDASLRAACRLGAAMQLTNIARDVGEDAGIGRLYLPRAWLREEGVEPDAWLAVPGLEDGLRETVRRVLDSADTLYAAAWPDIDRLPTGCRPAIRAAARVYADIGRKVREAGCDSFTSRTWTSVTEKARLLVGAALGKPGAWSARAGRSDAAVSVTDDRSQLLVEAALAG